MYEMNSMLHGHDHRASVAEQLPFSSSSQRETSFYDRAPTTRIFHLQVASHAEGDEGVVGVDACLPRLADHRQAHQGVHLAAVPGVHWSQHHREPAGGQMGQGDGARVRAKRAPSVKEWSICNDGSLQQQPAAQPL